MIDCLEVRLFDERAGVVSIAGDRQRPENWAFAYDTSYCRGSAVPLSVSLPLRADPYSGAVVHNWFTNLLPEGAVREAIAARLRLPYLDDFSILAAVAGECAGAVSVSSGSREALRADDDTDLESLMSPHYDYLGEGSLGVLAAAHRLALAGAQDKIAVVRGVDETLRLPRDGGFSTHILKPDCIRSPGLCELEVLGTWLASRVGLDVPLAELVEVANRRAMLIERFDRTAVDDDAFRVRRLHQEDFCQALGYPRELKYELQGGPSLAGILRLVREMDSGCAATQGVLDWVIFCAVIGNADAHAKNLAILSDRDGRRRLAPFYDLVPTVVMSERLIDRTPALRIGSAQRIDAIGAADWRAFAGNTGYDPDFVFQRVESVATSVLDALDEVGHALISSGANRAWIRERALPALARNAGQIRSAIRK